MTATDDDSWVRVETSASEETTSDGSVSPESQSKTIEERYQKKSPIEHILLRPDTYIGSVERQEEDMFVVDEDRIVKRSVSYNPGLLKIFDEIIVNAADNKQRESTMDKLDVCIDQKANRISVRNNGKGIPIQLHKDEGVYVPTLIFGHLLTGSNFDDEEKKTTGGRNGYGAKLTNVFSKEFEIECVHVESGKYFQQIFRDNMSTAEDPVVKNLTKAQNKTGDYVRVSFVPDLKRFKMESLDDDICGLFRRRAYDVAASLTICSGQRLTVTLNGKKLPIKSFEDYIECHEGVNKAVAFQKTNRWEVGVGLAAQETHGSISFVNSIATTKGGKHVDYITDQVITHLLQILTKKKHNVTRSYIKNHLFVFCNCLIDNPAFDSQTKENLITTAKKFGSKCVLTDGFLKKIEKSEIVREIIKYSQFQDQKKLKSSGGKKRARITGIPKLDDANWAGTAKSRECTLIITEGDSAKSLAMAGLSVVGRDRYGVFPLRGKPLNVRDASQKQVMGNEEIRNLVTILGLKFETKYDEDNIKTLRYGCLMIMADQDTDGSHIKGLVINFLHFFWPSLLDVSGFLKQFITPIVKVSKGKDQVQTFFNLTEYEKWMKSTGNDGKGWRIKYYKGLGTSTSVEAKDYFSHLDLHEVRFADLSKDIVATEETVDPEQPDVLKSGTDMIDMVFRKNRVNDRKKWLENAKSTETYLDYAAVPVAGVRYTDFIDKEFLLFSVYDNMRSIPHIIDGFKPSQRKVLFGCFKRKLRGELKVAQLTGFIAEHSSYHHGEASLQGTIVSMATSFVGSNNVNLLTPAGQFGTRRMGGKDAASPRYIFTKLEPIARTVFHPDDDTLLNYLKDDGNAIEPDFYIPVIPMILVNGADGIGSGWSTSIPNHNPSDIVANIRRWIAGQEMQPMTPYFHGFTGDISEKGENKGSYIVTGKIERIDESTLVVSELPIRVWTQGYKEYLEKLMVGDDKQPCILLDFKENHTETTVHFTVKATKENIDTWEQEPGGLVKKFKLAGNLSTSNMVAFYNGKLTRFKNSIDILKLFCDVRSEFYVKRKARLVKNLSIEQRKLSNKARFVEEVCNGDLVVSNRRRAEILSELKEKKYDMFAESSEGNADEEHEGEDAASDGDLSMAELARGYDYLLGLKLWSLTFEKAEALRAERDTKDAELKALEATSPNQIWMQDLDAIELALEARDKAFVAAAREEKEAREKLKRIQGKMNENKGRRKTTKKRKQVPDPQEAVPVSGSDEDSNKKSKKPRQSSSPISPPI